MLTLAANETYVEEIKKSRFIARALRVDSAEEAIKSISGQSEADANHNCWAYCIGDAYRFSDDGEPGGTAGRPILAAIQGKGLDHTLVIVSRYFGGIKLGAGGLARAYGGCAAKCLDRAQKIEIKPKSRICITSPYAYKGRIFRVLKDFSHENLSENSTSGELKLSFTMEEEHTRNLCDLLKNACNGEISSSIETAE